MTLQNRVSPFGTLHAHPARGLFMGNRGRLHRAGPDGPVLATQRWRGRAWICCLTAFKGRRSHPMPDRGYTRLFFLDEATALAAGHRPCAECRRADYDAFRAALAAGLGLGEPPRAAAMDRLLHEARIDPSTGARRTWTADAGTLPVGAMVLPDGMALDGAPWLVTGRGMGRPWAFDGYGDARPMSGPMPVLTPEPVVRAIAAGYRPVLHPGAVTTPS